MDKGIGFIRTIFLPWLDVAAELRLHTDDPAVFRNDLENIVARDVNGEEARRKSVDVLMGIWCGNHALFRLRFTTKCWHGYPKSLNPSASGHIMA
jgi:hypothetical protein